MTLGGGDPPYQAPQGSAALGGGQAAGGDGASARGGGDGASARGRGVPACGRRCLCGVRCAGPVAPAAGHSGVGGQGVRPVLVGGHWVLPVGGRGSESQGLLLEAGEELVAGLVAGQDSP